MNGFLNIIPKTLESFYRKRLRVAMVSYHYEKPSISGVATHTRELAKNLVLRGCIVHIFCHGKKDRVYRENGVVVHSFEGISQTIKDESAQKKLEYTIFEYRVIPEVIREHRKNAFDILHSQGWLTKAVFLLKEIYRIKWVHTFHAIEKDRNKKLTKSEKRFQNMVEWTESNVNYCDAAIFVSKSLMGEGLKEYKLKRKIVIPNGVDTKFFIYSPIKRRNVLFIGRFSKEKGVHMFVDLIPEIMSIKNASITVVSPYGTLPENLVRLKGKIVKLKETFGNRLLFIQEALPQEKLKEFYRDCQVYIQPSSYESFGLCILEAMSTGRPVVAFHVGGIPEVLGNGGITVKTEKDFISKVKDLLEHKKKAQQLGKEARRRAKGFDWNIVTDKTLEVYTSIL